MTLRLAIENMDRLPDGGPVRVELKGRGLDIGRDAHLDWTLPDPSRYVSGKHCEIRYRDNEYWLYDVSTNGTFVNGAQFRLDAPYRLRDGDRLTIGPYIVAVSIEGGAPASGGRRPSARPGLRRATCGARSATSRRPTAATPIACAKGPATPGDFLDFATDAGSVAAAAPPSVWSAPAPGDRRGVACRDAPAPPPPPPPPDPRELPIVERPRPIRPADPVAAAPPPPPPSSLRRLRRLRPSPSRRRRAPRPPPFRTPRFSTASPPPPAFPGARSQAATRTKSPTRSARCCG